MHTYIIKENTLLVKNNNLVLTNVIAWTLRLRTYTTVTDKRYEYPANRGIIICIIPFTYVKAGAIL